MDPLSPIWDRISPKMWRSLLLMGLALTIWASAFAAVWFRMTVLLVAPLVVLMGLLLVYNYKPIFFLLIFAIPWSLHTEIGGTLALDLPTEPLMLLFLFIFLLNTLAGKQFRLTGQIAIFHILVLLIFFWAAYTTLLSEIPVRSFKWLLAKGWYLTTFVYMAQRLIQSPEDIRKIFWAFFLGMLGVVIFVTIKHAAVGFSFGEAHLIAYPLYANGVYYSATLCMFLPWVWFARTWYNPKSLQWYVILGGMVLMLLAIATAYKRMGWVMVMLMPILYLLIRSKFFERLVYAGSGILALIVAFLVLNNNFYSFAPSFKDVIWHKEDLGGHLEATFNGTEISGMERFYRWVAAKNMVQAMPLTGSGPGTFYPVYQHFTDDAFRTYVSDNPEQSTCHNYYLQTFAEQGFPGGILFLFLNLYMLIRGYRSYHQQQNPHYKSLVMMVMLSLLTIEAFIFLNELIEVDKIGPMFWLSLTIIHLSDQWHEKKS